MFTKALCPVLQKSLTDVLSNKAGYLTRTPTGFLDSIISPENRRGFSQIEVGTPNGGRRYVEISYPHPASTVAVPFTPGPSEGVPDPLNPTNPSYTGINAPRNSRSSTMCTDPRLAIRPQVQVIDPFSMSAAFSRTLALSEDDMGRICNFSTDEYRAEIIMSQINGITASMNQHLIGWLIGGNTPLPPGANVPNIPPSPGSIADQQVTAGLENPGYTFGVPALPIGAGNNIIPNGAGLVGNIVDPVNTLLINPGVVAGAPATGFDAGTFLNPVTSNLINQAGLFEALPQNWVRHVKSQFRRMGYNGRIITVGDGSMSPNGGISLFADLVNWGCCNSDGIDVSQAGNETYFFFDSDLEVLTQTPGLYLGYIPGTFQLVTYNEYSGPRRKFVAGVYEHDTIVDPFTGLSFDFKLYYDNCQELYLMNIGLQFMLWAAPRDMYGTNVPGQPFNPTLPAVAGQNPMLGVNHSLFFLEI